MFDKKFFKGKRILITGHTGFKGTWMCMVLFQCGANITGYSLEPSTTPSIFEMSGIQKNIKSILGDIRDYQKLLHVFKEVKPEIVIHMAAQPLVRDSYENPAYTYEVNVMGTVNVLECVRQTDSVRSFINVTTDKVYKNCEWEWGYRENEELNGYDPYSNSKSCSELVTSSYINSFFGDRDIAISTMRAGNVIGGGDFSANRIIPDCVRAALQGEKIVVRNPYSMRPYQHVLEPVLAYLWLAQEQFNNLYIAGSYNVGPDEKDCISTGRLVSLFCESWNKQTGDAVLWENKHDGGPHEAQLLKLDCSKIKSKLGWKPMWSVQDAINNVVEWTIEYFSGNDVEKCMEKQIERYILSLNGERK